MVEFTSCANEVVQLVPMKLKNKNNNRERIYTPFTVTTSMSYLKKCVIKLGGEVKAKGHGHLAPMLHGINVLRVW